MSKNENRKKVFVIKPGFPRSRSIYKKIPQILFDNTGSFSIHCDENVYTNGRELSLNHVLWQSYPSNKEGIVCLLNECLMDYNLHTKTHVYKAKFKVTVGSLCKHN